MNIEQPIEMQKPMGELFWGFARFNSSPIFLCHIEAELPNACVDQISVLPCRERS